VAGVDCGVTLDGGAIALPVTPSAIVFFYTFFAKD